jgi:hypothetical protein
MDGAYYRAAPGTPEHYAAYEAQFGARAGDGFPVPDDPAASYEIENAQELAVDRYHDWCVAEAEAAARVGAEAEPEAGL